jgi:hypothetical protein
MAAKGSKAWGICERCGLRSKYLDMIVEPGTGLFVDRLCNDGMWNRIDHPQNFSPKPRLEGQGLKNASPDRREFDTAFIYDDTGLPITADGTEVF